MEFSNREIATGVLIALGLILVLVFPRPRLPFIKAIANLLKTLLQWKLLLLIALYFLYAIGVVVIAATQGWWNNSLLSATMLTIVVTGFPLFMNANNYKTGLELTRKVVLEVAGLSALMAAYLNLGEFPIWGELILQPILLFAFAFIAMAPQVSGGKKAARVLEVLLGLFAVGLIGSTTLTLISETKSFDWLYEIKSFALSFWLPIALIPFLYVVAMFMQIEGALVRLKMHNDQKRPPLRIRWALVLGFRGSLRYAGRFSGLWITDMSAQRHFREGISLMGKYRKAVRNRVDEQRARDRECKRLAGQKGVDEQGFWLDRREFYETREALNDTWFTQAAIFRNGGKYLDESFVISSARLRKLPSEHGIEIALSKNPHSWYAWRKTAGGYYFGTGGTEDVNARWQYGGTEPPTSPPRSSKAGWVNLIQNNPAAEWSTSRDRPIPLV